MFSRVLLIFLGFARAVVGEDLQTCGVAQYYPSQYTCFDNDFLCPKDASGTYLPCNGACYLPSQYACSNNQLVQVNPSLPPELLQCGSAQFYSSQYVCYDNNFLCPVLNGQADLPCGNACYSNTAYNCINNELVQIPQPTCVSEYSSCEAPNGVILSCCTGLSCVATKCRNLTTIGT